MVSWGKVSKKHSISQRGRVRLICDLMKTQHALCNHYHTQTTQKERSKRENTWRAIRVFWPIRDNTKEKEQWNWTAIKALVVTFTFKYSKIFHWLKNEKSSSFPSQKRKTRSVSCKSSRVTAWCAHFCLKMSIRWKRISFTDIHTTSLLSIHTHARTTSLLKRDTNYPYRTSSQGKCKTTLT